MLEQELGTLRVVLPTKLRGVQFTANIYNLLKNIEILGLVTKAGWAQV